MRTVYLAFPRMTISLTAGEEVLEKAFVFYPFSQSEGKPLFVTHAYRVEREEQKWVVTKDGEVLDSRASAWEAVFVLEYDIELSILEQRGDWLAIHAGCVAVADGACLVAGNPDSGKTTTTFHLVELGWKFMCEEIAFIDSEKKEVHPFLQTLSLDKRFIDAVKGKFPVRRGKVHELNPSLVRYSPELIREEPLRLSTILVPKREPEAEGEAEAVSLSPGAFLTEFLGYCFEPREGMEDLVDRVIGVLEDCRIYRIVYRDISDCRRILIRLFPSASA